MNVPAYSGQPFDAQKKRQEFLSELQERMFTVYRQSGAVPMTSEVTRILPPPATGLDLLSNINSEVARASAQFGPRFLDRHKADPSTSYRAARYNLLSGMEGVRTEAYDDRTGKRVQGKPLGNVTVGLGFNMDRTGARETWEQVFGNDLSFDDVYNGRAAMSPEQVRTLFDYDVQQFEQVVSKAAGNRTLTQNQRLALLSVAYTSPARVSEWSSLIQSGDDGALTNAILYNSFAKGHSQAKALAARRYKEAALFNSVSQASQTVPEFRAYQSFAHSDEWDVSQFKSKHYSWQDFRNDRFSDAKVNAGLVGLLDATTDQFGQKLKLTSGYRSPEYNAKASFTGKEGPHTHGYAADIDVSGYTDAQKSQLVATLIANGARGVGHYDNGSIHVDLRPQAGKGPGGLALWYGQNQPYTAGQSWFSQGVDKGLASRS